MGISEAGLLAQPSVFIIQVIAIALVFVSNLIYYCEYTWQLGFC